MGALRVVHAGDSTALLDYSVAARALGDARESGDLCSVVPVPYGRLVAVTDGLGHGYEAALASRIAIAALEVHCRQPIDWLLAHCHQALLKTRGVAMCLAALDARDATMTWISIGNVEGVLLRIAGNGVREREHVMMRSGVVGHRLPPLRTTTLPLRPGDLLLFATDGVREGFDKDASLDAPPQEIADGVLARYGKDTDDALVLAGRWRGSGSGAP
jgi:phosphoserine phosphatase RsbX